MSRAIGSTLLRVAANDASAVEKVPLTAGPTMGSSSPVKRSSAVRRRPHSSNPRRRWHLRCLDEDGPVMPS